MRGYDHRARHAVRVAAALVIVVLATGCERASDAPETTATTTRTSQAMTPQSPTETPSASPDATAVAIEEALAAYRGFREAQVVAERAADPSHEELERYAGDQALADERVNLVQMANAGVVMTGEPTFNPEVTSVDLGETPTVAITDCIDTTGWTPIYEETGKSAVAPGQPARVLATALARPYEDRWLITEVTTDRSQSC